jgi:hypothetical protein
VKNSHVGKRKGVQCPMNSWKEEMEYSLFEKFFIPYVLGMFFSFHVCRGGVLDLTTMSNDHIKCHSLWACASGIS